MLNLRPDITRIRNLLSVLYAAHASIVCRFICFCSIFIHCGPKKQDITYSV